MSTRVAPATVGAVGVDLSTPLSAEQAAALRALGLAFAARYVGLDAAPAASDLSAGELAAITGAGLALLIVQHVRVPGWAPSAGVGGQDGATAARHAVAAGVPPGATLWLDLEGCAAGTSAASVAGHVAAWAASVRAAGYDPGCYVGAGVPLDAQGLWHLAVDRYWRSQSDVPAPATRGYQLIQLYPTVRIGDLYPGAPPSVTAVEVDVDVAQQDYRGDRPTMVVA